MSNLFEQYQGHNVFQTLNNKLEEINNALQDDNYNEVQKDSLLAYQQLLSIIQANLNTRTLPLVPNTILNNLNAAIQNLHISYLINLDSYYQYYQQLIDSYNRIPRVEKKSEIKESYNSLIDNFIHNKEEITTQISNEIEGFHNKQEEQFDAWTSEKEKMQEEINELREQNDELKNQINTFEQTISKQQEKINNLIEKFQTEYDENTEDFETRFTTKEDEYNQKIESLLNNQKENALNILNHLKQRKDEVEKLWGIIGQAAISGNSQNYANKAKNMANGLMVLTLLFMVVGLLYIGTATIALFKGEVHYIDFVWKVITSAIILVPTLYTANLSKRQRDREFQLRDFEVKTACLEAFVESLQMDEKENEKNKLKLELTKAFFKDEYSKANGNDCVLIPKEIAKILNTMAKKCNLNINIGAKDEQNS